MITLILYNLEGYVYYAITNTERVLYSTSIYVPKKATEVYMEAIERSFAMLSIQPSEIKRILCTCGPSSFTATRLILSTALGIAIPNSIPIGSLSTLEALAYNCPVETQKLWVLIPEQKNSVYTQSFRITQNSYTMTPQKNNEIALYTYDEFFSLPLEDCYILGNITEEHRTKIQTRERCQILPLYYTYPNAFIIHTHCNDILYSHTPPEPLYLRVTDAEENITTIAQKLGFSQEDIVNTYNNR